MGEVRALALLCACIAAAPAPAADYAPRDLSTSERTKVVMLGSGMPLPDPKRLGPGVAVVVDDEPYLFDAGEGIWRATGAATPAYGGKIAGLAGAKLTRVFITHLHSDHTIGIPSIILSPWTMGRRTPIDIFGPPGTARMVDLILQAYSEDIAIRRYDSSQLNDTGWRARGHDVIAPAVAYQDDRVKIEAVANLHTTWPHSYAYRITTPDRVIVISGDTRPAPNITEAARGADILIHEVIGIDDSDKQPWGKSKNVPLDFGDVALHFHTTTKQLVEIARAAKPKLLVLYHEQNWSQPYNPDALVDEMKRYGYDGKVVSARDQDIY